MKLIINEAKTINDEYNANWSAIPRDVFDQIIALDPQTNIERNLIGPNAKQLLLPKYRDGEQDILDYSDNIRDAISIFISNRNNYSIKNIAAYPSVRVFVDHINDPENNPVNAIEIKKESNIDKIYNKYYNDIPRDIFDYIISIDPTTNLEKDIVGEISKSFLLPAYKKGDNKIADKSFKRELEDILSEYNEVKTRLPKLTDNERKAGKIDYKDIASFKSVEELVNFLKDQTESSDLLTYLKKSPLWGKDIRYVGSTRDHDILEPLTIAGAALIAGAHTNVGGPGVASSDNGSINYNSNVYGHWCTTYSQGSFWNNYRNKGTGNGIYYDFMAKGNKITADNRTHNFQIAVDSSGNVVSSADGKENFDSDGPRYWKVLIAEDPEVLTVLARDSKVGKDIPEVKAYIEFRNNPNATIFEYENSKSILDFNWKYKDYNFDAKGFIKKVIIKDGVENIPIATFLNWSSLTEVKFPSSLKMISTDAFKNCRALKTIKLLDCENLEYIGAHAFANCVSLSGTVFLPNSLTRIQRQAFLNTKIDLRISSDRTNKLQIDPNDMQWYKDHLKFLDVTKENLEEEYLDENIPRDLLAAYRNSKHKSSDTYSAFHTELGSSNASRRLINYDYGNSEYKEISADKALQLIKNNPSDVNQLRVLYDGDLIEWEYKGDGKFYCLYGDSTKPVIINGKNYRNIRYLNPRQLLPYADKIYWTDEYSHPITPDSDKGKDREEKEATNILYTIPNIRNSNDTPYDFISVEKSWGNRNNTDYYDDYKDDPDDSFKDRFRISYKDNNSDAIKKGKVVRDTGNHNHSILYDENIELNNTFKEKERTYKIYNNTRKALIELRKNKDLYDDEEYEQLEYDLKDDLQASLKNYQNAYNEFIKAKKNLVDGYQSKIKFYNNALLKRLIRLKLILKDAEEKNKELRDLQNQLSKVSAESVIDSDQYKASVSTITAVENIIVEYQKAIKTNIELIKNARDKIAALEAEINDREKQNTEFMNTVDNKAQILDDAKKAAENVAAEVAIQKANKIDELSQKIDDLKDFLTSIGYKHYDKKKHKDELDSRLADLLKWVETNNSEDDSNI